MDGCVFCIAAAAVAAIVYLVVEEANKCDGNNQLCRIISLTCRGNNATVLPPDAISISLSNNVSPS